MKALETYDIDITVDGRSFKLDPKQLAFTIPSSIWTLTPKTNFIIEDTTGLIHEYLLTVPGTEVTIVYGKEDVEVKGTYYINNDLISDSESQIVINGPVEMGLEHVWTKEQIPKTDAYKNTISSVIDEIAGNYDFESTNIDTTENNNTWYQGLRTDECFIEKILLPKAFSSGARGTPFFCYIDNKNNFNLKHYQSLFSSSTSATLIYAALDADRRTEDGISLISRKNKSFKENKLFYKTKSYIIDIDDASIKDEDTEITDFPEITKTKTFAMRKLNTTDPTRVRFYDRNYDPDDIKGERIFEDRESVSQDVFLLLIPFKPDLIAGNTVQLKIYASRTSDKDDLPLSQYSGDYLIEKCFHIWDGFSASAITKLIVSRKFASYSNDYSLKEQMKS